MTPTDLTGKLGRVPRSTIWFGLFGAPLMWFVQINLGLAFSSVACGGSRVPLYTLHALAVLVGLGGLAVTWWLRGAARQQPRELERGVTAYLARFGLVHNGLMLYVISLTAAVSFFLEACRLR